VPGITCNHRDRHRTLRILVAGAVLLALCAATVLAGAGADPANAARAKVIGKTKNTPQPSCPRSPCEAIGGVTGFQVSASNAKNPFKVRRNGRLVAWSVDLSRPKPSQRRFFGKFYRSEGFGTAPSARIAVIEPKGKRRYKLKRHGPAVGLNEHLGETPIFTLANPLSIKKGEILALTVPSWISDFAVGQSRRNAWRASRRKNQCAGNTDIKNSRPHEKVGSNRVYGCTYRTARLLYWGYYTTGG
jgi:hypothetical protein